MDKLAKRIKEIIEEKTFHEFGIRDNPKRVRHKEFESEYGSQHVYYADETRLDQVVKKDNFAAVVVEYGTIDTNHELYLVDLNDESVEKVNSCTVRTPSYVFPRIKINSLQVTEERVKLEYESRNKDLSFTK